MVMSIFLRSKDRRRCAPGQRVLHGLRRRARLRHALRDVVAGHRAVAADESGSSLAMALKTGLPIFIAILCVRLHAVGAGVAGAALHRVELTSTLVPISLSISSVFLPMFCTRPWQGMW
jgi:hypothetical protein